MARWRLLPLLVIVVGCSGGDDGPSLETNLLTGTAALPAYATYCNIDSHAGLSAAAFATDATHTVSLQLTEIPAPVPSNAELTTLALPQGVQVGTDSTGAAFVIVVTTDYEASNSAVVWFKDTDGDGLPDQGSRDEIATSVGHLVSGALDHASGTFYVVDAKNNRILRCADTDGDMVPDGALAVFADASTLQVETLGKPTVDGAALHAVNVVRPPFSGDRRQNPFVVRITDSNQDGTADQAVYVPPPPYADLVGDIHGGDTIVEVQHSAGTYRVDALNEDATVKETLATFAGGEGATEVVLSRALVANEPIAVFDMTAQEHRGVVVPHGTGTVISHVKDAGFVAEGGTLTFVGDGITGNETVLSRLASAQADAPWLSCSISAHTDTTLTVVVPEYGLTGMERAMFQITTTGGEELLSSALVKPD